MRHYRVIFSAAILCAALAACTGSSDEKRAQQMLDDIEVSLSQGDYRSALDSITILRSRYPEAVEARKKALALWQEASLLQAQAEAAQTEALLQETLAAIDTVPTLLEQNLLRNRRDSLQARYDAAVGVIKVIEDKQHGNDK